MNGDNQLKTSPEDHNDNRPSCVTRDYATSNVGHTPQVENQWSWPPDFPAMRWRQLFVAKQGEGSMSKTPL